MIELFKPYMPNELPELNSILHSGSLAYGKWGNLFEKKLGKFIGNSQIAVVNSYNSAMLIALSVIGAKPGDEIIASPMSCLASTLIFTTQHLKVVWADIDPNTGTLCPDSVRSKITSKTKAIFHNHYCGYLGYVNEINEIGREEGIVVVDDAIEAFGSEYKGHILGNTGADITIFSFQSVRLPNAIDGGAVAFKNDDFYRKALLIRDYGIDRSRFRDNFGEINPTYDISNSGYGATLSDINSYVGVLQMDSIEELIQIQRKNAENWMSIIQQNIKDCQFINYRLQDRPNYWIFGFLTPEKDKLLMQFREEGYYASGVHLPNNNYSVFGFQGEFPGVELFHSKFLAIPCGWWFTR